jgi:CRP-like cAMP-binding protein
LVLPELSRPVRILQEISLFSDLEPLALREIAHAAQYVTVRRDAYFFYEGDPAEMFYILRRGRVKATQAAPGGREILLHFVLPGDIFGSMAALGEGTYPMATQAVHGSEALGWEGSAMAAFMANHPTISLHILENYASTVEDLRERIRDLATTRVESRVARALLRLAEQTGWPTEEGVLIDMRLSRQDLAEMTGTTLYTVSRILQGWDRAGLVQVGRQRVAVRDREGLATMLAD